MMWEDPVVNEIRKMRMEIEQECGNDLDRIFAQAMEIQKQFADKQATLEQWQIKRDQMQRGIVQVISDDSERS